MTLRLVRRLGWAAAYDAVLTGFLICAHHWSNIKPASDTDAWRRWHQRAHTLTPAGTARTTFSASRLFAAVYPEAVTHRKARKQRLLVRTPPRAPRQRHHHRHIQPVLIRKWSPAMAEYAGTIWASQTLLEHPPKPPGGRTITRAIGRR